MSSDEEEVWKGYLYTGLLFTVSMLNALLFEQAFHYMITICLAMKSALQSIIIRKSLRLSNQARTEFTSGEMINLMAVDAQQMQGCFYNFGALFCIPYQVVLAFYFLYQELGVAAFAGLVIMLINIPFHGLCGKLTKKYEKEQLRNKDNRMKVMNEVLHGIKVVKLYAWEKPFIEKVKAIRSNEIETLKKLALTRALNSFLGTFGPFLVTICVFILYIYIDASHTLLESM